MTDTRRHPIFEEIGARLYSLADKDPHLAIAEGRNSKTWSQLGDLNSRILKSAFLIDVGSRAHDEHTISEGCDLLRELTARLPDRHDLLYNLGNGLIAQADENAEDSPEWYLACFMHKLT
ncbi:MAG: hypothetical protein QME66_13665 [Candidatus Eisenbacteria bacterium]|nr:hypothetical protein [Candidatus Eisenbacteria bacterium]